ncbi:hypothetical protein [Bacillus rubiinfantis]|uniref:hypothetical protein n=1 Tax=Bacillus rubiinfantis TaxID=1499680 RepID=UPI000B117356|nr:hypothetical protein [Bacillus rubiinfantis]
MNKKESQKQGYFVFDEQATNIVSEQIMDAYNSGFIGQAEDGNGENYSLTDK